MTNLTKNYLFNNNQLNEYGQHPVPASEDSDNDSNKSYEMNGEFVFDEKLSDARLSPLYPAQYGFIQQIGDETSSPYDEYGTSIAFVDWTIYVGAPKNDKNINIEGSF